MFYPLLFTAIGLSMAYSLNAKWVLNHDHINPRVFTFLMQIGTGIFTLMVAIYMGFGFDFNIKSVLMILAMGLTYACASTLYNTGLKHTDLSEATVLDSNAILWTQLYGVLFLNESVGISRAMAALLVMLAIILVGWNFKINRFSISKYGLMIVGAGALYALGASWDKELLKYANSAFTYMPFSYLAGGVLTGLINYRDISQKNLKPFFGKHRLFLRLILACAIMSAMYTIIFSLYKNFDGQVSVIYPSQQVESVILPILGIIFLKERKNIPQKLVAAVMAFVGVVLISR